jgi:hypothetical protein
LYLRPSEYCGINFTDFHENPDCSIALRAVGKYRISSNLATTMATVEKKLPENPTNCIVTKAMS